jgi:hypothetical protein
MKIISKDDDFDLINKVVTNVQDEFGLAIECSECNKEFTLNEQLNIFKNKCN